MSVPVYIAGVGAISAIGMNIAETLTAFELQQAGMGGMSYLDSIHRNEFPVAEVKAGNDQLATIAGMAPTLPRTALLSMIAAKEALNNANLDHRSFRTGFVSANTVGGMDKTEQYYASSKKRLRDLVYHECGSVTDLVAEQLDATAFITTISTACSSSANSIFFGARLIRNNMVDVVIAGGADALTKFTLNGFNTLMILDREPCKPFDENRKGLNLGEGAGYVVLVSEKIAAKLKNQPLARLSGYSNANDAYHQTASSPDGTGSFLAMSGALEKSGLDTSEIDYINLHGTGTNNNDHSEATAIKRLFDPQYPKIGSTKSFTGHTLGASGGLEAVFSVLALTHGWVYPNLRFSEPMKEYSFRPETQFLKNQDIHHVMSNSFGFGGNCSSLIFSKT